MAGLPNSYYTNAKAGAYASGGFSVADVLRKISGNDSLLTMLANRIDGGGDSSATDPTVAARMGMVGQSPLADRSVPYQGSTGRNKTQHNLTPIQQLLLMAQGGPDASTGGATGPNPYSVAIRTLQHQYGLSQAQTTQNIADIGSWFGQYANEARGAARSNRKAGRVAAKDSARFSGDILSGIADPNVARAAAQQASIDQRYIGRSNASENRFDRRMVADASRQEAYQKIVQERLGAQAQMDIRDKIAMARAQKAAYSVSNNPQQQQFSNILSVLRLLPQDQRTAYLQGGQTQASPFGTKERGDMSGVLSELVGSKFDKNTNRLLEPVQELFPQLKVGLSGAGYDLTDPRILQAYKSWLFANLPQITGSGGKTYKNMGLGYQLQGG